MELETRSITELRGILSAMGGSVQFGDAKNILLQKIRLRLSEEIKPPEVLQTAVPEDQRLRTVPPARNMGADVVQATLQPFIDKGLRLSFTEDGGWAMAFGKKRDSGTLRMPLRVVVDCARSVMA